MNEKIDGTVVEDVVETAEIDYKAELEKARAELELVKAKKDELYRETKTAKQQREEALKEAKRIEQEKAMRDGEYEKLFKQRDDEYKQLEQKLAADRQERRNEKIEIQATRVAAELAKGDAHKAELLSVFVARSISSIADENGIVDGSALDSVRKQFETDSKYQPLLGGNLSVGGSAPGNTRSAGVDHTKTMTMGEYENLSPTKKLEFSRLVQSGKAELI